MTPLLIPDEVARVLGVRPKTLKDWRGRGRGPAFFRIGRLVRYRESDVTAWVESQRIVSRVETLVQIRGRR